MQREKYCLLDKYSSFVLNKSIQFTTGIRKSNLNYMSGDIVIACNPQNYACREFVKSKHSRQHLPAKSETDAHAHT